MIKKITIFIGIIFFILPIVVGLFIGWFIFMPILMIFMLPAIFAIIAFIWGINKIIKYITCDN